MVVGAAVVVVGAVVVVVVVAGAAVVVVVVDVVVVDVVVDVDVVGIVVGAVVSVERGFTVVVVAGEIVDVGAAGVVVVVSSTALRVRTKSSNFRSSTGGNDALTTVDCNATGITASVELAPRDPLSTTVDFLPDTLTDSREISLSPVCFAIS